MEQYNLEACPSKSSQCVTWVKIHRAQDFNKYYITAQIIVYRVRGDFFTTIQFKVGFNTVHVG